MSQEAYVKSMHIFLAHIYSLTGIVFHWEWPGMIDALLAVWVRYLVTLLFRHQSWKV